MGIFTKLAWRNLWRQKRRTLITLSAIALGLCFVILIVNVTKGMRERMIAGATGSMIGHAQIHRTDYRQTGEPELWMPDGDALLATVESHPNVTVATPRIIVPVLAAMGDRAASLTLYGIDPEREKKVTNWDERLVAGVYPDAPNRVLIGAKLADKLEVEVDSKLVLTMADLHTGELNSQLVRVSGIMVSESPALNEHMVVSTLDLARRLSGLQQGLHEITLRLDVQLEDAEALDAITATWQRADIEAVSWQVLMASLLSMLQVQDTFLWVTFGVVFLLAALGIANTMSMSLLERVREFGVMQAIGTTPRNLSTMVILEYACMGVVGGLLGFVLGSGLCLWLSVVGIPMNNVEMMGVVLNEPLYPIMDWPGTLAQVVVFILLVPLLAWLPIRKMRRFDPAQSLRFEG